MPDFPTGCCRSSRNAWMAFDVISQRSMANGLEGSVDLAHPLGSLGLLWGTLRPPVGVPGSGESPESSLDLDCGTGQRDAKELVCQPQLSDIVVAKVSTQLSDSYRGLWANDARRA